MTMQQTATNSTANAPWGDSGLSVAMTMYKSKAVEPNKLRYNMPSCACVERSTPEIPAGKA
jgi:hypothetical protein